MAKSIRCNRCGGWCYSDDPYNPKADIWCLMCGDWQRPAGFKPLPFVSRNDDTYDDSDWHIDEHGDIVDVIDRRIEGLIAGAPDASYNVSYVAKEVHCSNSEARMTLDRLARNGELELYVYGPMDRWSAYRRKVSTVNGR